MKRLGFRTDLRGSDPAVPHAQSFLVAQGVWMTAAFAGLQLVGAFTVENYFVLCYFGLVVTAQTFAPTDRSERWWPDFDPRPSPTAGPGRPLFASTRDVGCRLSTSKPGVGRPLFFGYMACN